MLTWQSDFARAVRSPDWAVPHGVTSHNSDAPRERFAVYRNNVMVGLVSALEARFPATRKIVGEIHLAGHFETMDGQGSPLCIDAHGTPVIEDVFTLFDSVIARAGPLPTLIEWDNDVPEWPVLRAEVLAAQARLDRARLVRVAPAAA